MSHRARKRFGQNFLHDPTVIRRIVQAIRPAPGQGAITLPLLEACGHLEVVELDRDLIQPLAMKAAPIGELVIHQQDALRFDFSSLASDKPIRVVGNLPYNISTPLIFHLLEQAVSIEDMHFMLQKEVVDRMAAAPGNKDYGRLSVMTQYHAKVDSLFRVGAGAFQPAPKVESAFVRLQPYREPRFPVKDIRYLDEVVKKAFSQRRKTLRNTLKELLSEQDIIDTGIDPALRPENISLEQYAALADHLAQRLTCHDRK